MVGTSQGCCFRRIFSHMTHKRKELYESASEAAGMVLEYLSQVEGETEGEVHDLVSEFVFLFFSARKEISIVGCAFFKLNDYD